MGDIKAPKQVIVMRKDLKLRRGKEISQACHATMKFLCDKMRSKEGNQHEIFLSEVEVAWIHGNFTKICVQVSSEAELIEIHQKALAQQLASCLIQDAGLTEFKGVPTLTCVAIGPDLPEKIDKVTGHLSLY